MIDRLAYWYYHPREWLKKAALMNGTYLLNSPFTFQSMEKHSAYCAMLRLGLKIPQTVLVPYKNPVDNVRWAYTSAKYNKGFDLDAIAEDLGYPLYMKPFDGGGWRGVSRINNKGRPAQGLRPVRRDADAPAGDDRYDKFARALSIGAETMVMDFRPDEPMHNRYAVSHDFLSPSAGHQTVAISRIVNAFFGWEFNSCEMLVAGDSVHPIDYANACPDVAVTSLHYYFPWAISALVKWSVFSARDRPPQPVDLRTERYFDIADDESLDYDAKLEAYLALADEHFETAEYHEWCAEHLGTSTPASATGSPAPTSTASSGNSHHHLPRQRTGEVLRPLQGPDQPLGPRQPTLTAAAPGQSSQPASRSLVNLCSGSTSPPTVPPAAGLRTPLLRLLR